MKKALLISLTAVFLSCTSDINKKINITQYNDLIKQIRSSNSEFVQEDFKTAAKEFDKYVYKAMLEGHQNLDITYKELLDNAKKINLKKQQELDAYNKELQKLKNVCVVKLLTGKYIDLSHQETGYSDGYKMDLKIKNTSNKTISAIKGRVLLYNANNEQLISYLIEENIVLKPSQEIEGEDFTIIFEDDNLMELKVLPFSRIKQEWQPEIIIFEDGSRLDALEKPMQ